MRSTLLAKLSVALVANAILPSVSFAGPTSVTCTSVISGTVNANVVIPSGARCAITQNATINGNVSVGIGATLYAGEGVTINQNLEADSDSIVLMGPAATLKGRYGANRATTGILESNLAQSVGFNGGSYAILGNVVGNITCGGSASGAISTAVGVLNTGCAVGTLATVVNELSAIADKAGNSGGSGLTCEQLETVALIYETMTDISNAACDAGGGQQVCEAAANSSGKASAYEEVYNANCVVIP